MNSSLTMTSKMTLQLKYSTTGLATRVHVLLSTRYTVSPKVDVVVKGFEAIATEITESFVLRPQIFNFLELLLGNLVCKTIGFT